MARVDASLMTNETAGQQSRVLSQRILEPIRAYQNEQGPNAGKVHTLIILSALAFVVGVLIGRLKRNDYKEARDYFYNQVDKIREELE